jgi:hypothetical protein
MGVAWAMVLTTNLPSRDMGTKTHAVGWCCHKPGDLNALGHGY